MFFRGTNWDRIVSSLTFRLDYSSYRPLISIQREFFNHFQFNRININLSCVSYLFYHICVRVLCMRFFSASLESLFRDATWEKRNFSRTRNNVVCNALRTATPICAVVYCVNEWLTCRCLRRPHLCYHMTDVMSRLYSQPRTGHGTRSRFAAISHWLFSPSRYNIS